MSLATITRHGPEISDAIVSFDPITLQRKPVKKADVLIQFRELRNQEAVRIVEQMPEQDGVLDPAAVDKILITSHCEMQRMSEEFQHGKRVAELLKRVLNSSTRCLGRRCLGSRRCAKWDHDCSYCIDSVPDAWPGRRTQLA